MFCGLADPENEHAVQRYTVCALLTDLLLVTRSYMAGIRRFSRHLRTLERGGYGRTLDCWRAGFFRYRDIPAANKNFSFAGQ